MSTVGCVGFSNGPENLGLGEVSASGEQNIPCVRYISHLERIQHGKEDQSYAAEGTEDQQPGFVSESRRDVGDGDGEAGDEQERLQTGRIEHQVELRVCVEGQSHQERGRQHDKEHHTENRGVSTSEHVQSNLQCVSQEQNGWTDHEPFPPKSNDTERNPSEGCVGHGRLALFGHVVEGTNKGQRMRRCGLGEAGRASVLHRSQPIHEPDRDEEHHERIVVGECPGRVGHVSWHEGDEPSSQNSGAFAKVVSGHDGDGEHRERTVNGGESKHAPPDRIFR